MAAAARNASRTLLDLRCLLGVGADKKNKTKKCEHDGKNDGGDCERRSLSSRARARILAAAGSAEDECKRAANGRQTGERASEQPTRPASLDEPLLADDDPRKTTTSPPSPLPNTPHSRKGLPGGCLNAHQDKRPHLRRAQQTFFMFSSAN